MVDLKKQLEKIKKLHPLERLERLQPLIRVVENDKKLKKEIQKAIDQASKELQELRIWKHGGAFSLGRRYLEEAEEVPQEENLEEIVKEAPPPPEEVPLKIYSPEQEEKKEYKTNPEELYKQETPNNNNVEVQYQTQATTGEQEENLFNQNSISKQLDNYKTKKEKKKEKNGSGY